MLYWPLRMGTSSMFLTLSSSAAGNIWVGGMSNANLRMRLTSRGVVINTGELHLVGPAGTSLFIKSCIALRSRMTTKISCQRLPWGIFFGWTISRMTYAMKHASPMSMCLRDSTLLCSSCHLDCLQIFTFTRGQNSIYDSGITVSRYDANIVH
jgi:hypothetical protein